MPPHHDMTRRRERASRAEMAARLRARVPPSIRRVATYLIRHLPGRRTDWGTMRRLKPFSDCHGWDRGLPVDRYYIESFLRARAASIRGDGLEVRAPMYLRKFGHNLSSVEVADINPRNPDATLIVDLCEAGSLAPNSFDCVIVTQTLHFLLDARGALRNMFNALRPEGVLLLTVPALNRLDSEAPESDYWRFTPVGLRSFCEQACPEAAIEVEGYGNMIVGIATLAGLSVEELEPDELQAADDRFPIISCACLRKQAA